MATARRRAIDLLRRRAMSERKYAEVLRELETYPPPNETDNVDAALDDQVGDDLLRLDVHRVPSGVVDRRAGRAHVALAGRVDHRRDRARVPRQGVDGRAADRARQADVGRGAGAVRGAARRRARRARLVGARRHLPHLQRGLRRDRGRRLDATRALRRRAPPRPSARRAVAARARGARPRLVDGDPSIAVGRASGPRRRAGAVARPGPITLGLLLGAARPGGARARRVARWPARSVHVAGRDRGVPRTGADGRVDRLAAHRRARTTRSRSSRRRRSSS